MLRPTVCFVMSGLLSLPLINHVLTQEGGSDQKLFVIATSLAIVAMLLLVTRRALLSAAIANGIIMLAVVVADAKYDAMGMTLHAYDIVFYLSSWATVSFLWHDFRVYCFGLLIGMMALAALISLAWSYDSTRVPRHVSAVLATLFIVLGGIGAHWKGEPRHTQYHWDDLHLSSFYSSWAETINTLWRGQLIESAAAAPSGSLLTVPRSCSGPGKPPNIILIHEESVVPPQLFPQLGYNKGLDPFFRSFDGKFHKMQVETYGGASWLTEFSVLAGVSTQSFGGMRNFVQYLMAGKIHDTLPEALARCGYRNTVFYPLMRSFVGNARFYTSVGMKEIFDSKDQKAPTYQERDKFYFANALNFMARHFKERRQPLFTFVITSATHSPYDYKYDPNENVEGGAPGTHPEMNEYLRRLTMAQKDYREFRAELAKRFPDEAFIIVHYGDHQPVATKSLLGLDQKLDTEDLTIALNSPAYFTYYAVDAINTKPPPLPDVAALDVPYLPLVILESAGLPLSDSFRERQRLREACNGRYFSCADQERILAFHRKMIDSGLIEAR